VRRRVLQPNDSMCAGGCGSIETAYHFFLECDLFINVWYLICLWLGISFFYPGHIKELYLQFNQLAGMPRASYSYLSVIWLASVWTIWKDRNNCVFKNVVIDPHNIFDKMKQTSFLWLSSNFIPLTFGFHDWW